MIVMSVIIVRVVHSVVCCCFQEKACEEQTSFDLTPYDLASAIDVVNRLLVEQARDVSRGESFSDNFSDDSPNG